MYVPKHKQPAAALLVLSQPVLRDSCLRFQVCSHHWGSIDGFGDAEPSAVGDALAAQGIVVTAKDRYGVRGLRVSPHVCTFTSNLPLHVRVYCWQIACVITGTTEEEIDGFVAALREIRDRMAQPQPRL